MPKNSLSSQQRNKLLKILRIRFEENPHRHKGIAWTDVESRLLARAGKLWSLNEMERTGGEPDVIGCDPETGEIVFYDCSLESPGGRRGLCYDRRAMESRKEHRPRSNALDMATAMGVELLTEVQYRELQQHGAYDLKTSSWVRTPERIRELGGALFCDRRFDTVFLYHNGAESYYAARGFRAELRI